MSIDELRALIATLTPQQRRELLEISRSSRPTLRSLTMDGIVQCEENGALSVKSVYDFVEREAHKQGVLAPSKRANLTSIKTIMRYVAEYNEAKIRAKVKPSTHVYLSNRHQKKAKLDVNINSNTEELEKNWPDTWKPGKIVLKNLDASADRLLTMCNEAGLNPPFKTIKGLRSRFRQCRNFQQHFTEIPSQQIGFQVFKNLEKSKEEIGEICAGAPDTIRNLHLYYRLYLALQAHL